MADNTGRNARCCCGIDVGYELESSIGAAIKQAFGHSPKHMTKVPVDIGVGFAMCEIAASRPNGTVLIPLQVKKTQGRAV